ncbi:histidine--tRNA ligase [Candidatus Saccharibacteria bacterium CG11_big_fil_rev_8_21_14_0_20_41_19]|nr:histidine--tRNA ligase [Candidatus Saccharibacteria bacterium]OIP86225.1 MAG: histidine--tRNA ligase [Candidatus Saccharibacteria bacterium CG2_30_41_52]PIQ71037.1 MAG: histidine--tRNA ligase [Candidatus Saccharibacteria bacterium CG11_big_fil_rev_8_21_14_0_20_41_19]PIZ59428.1 MAG: histidine--tRNA ligase [Candidatus Saccharibacteria bacterium CG_4_10_14_0_2_um_filter_41_11]PJC29381.1 MAG: histidine--tRNA ligase [Candidatus Saccharibacteria bacterium CG_4_9_14_0_2_um_filter_41_9]PJE66060.1 M
MSTLSSQPYKGTRDYYPEDKRIQNYIFSVWHKVSRLYGYEEYGAPTLEPLEAYMAKSGQELAGEQTYTFTDRGGRIVAIRPEMTPTISRMVAARRQELSYPARLYSIANFMRYERPQRGREREFWQLNVDIFGADGVAAEAEILTLADNIMKEFGAQPTDYVIRINNRKLINFMMAQYFGLDGVQGQAMMKLFDRKNKISEQDFIIQATEIFGDQADDGIKKVHALLAATSMADLPAEIRDSAAVTEIQELFTLLERAGVKSLVFDITLMRGLDYYTGMVFEVFDTHPDNNRALFGGGRYDGLVGLFGAESISAVGMAPGGTMMENFISVHNLMPKQRSTTDVYIAVLGDTVREAGKLARDLRDSGIRVELDIVGHKLDKQIKTVVKKAIPYILFIGEEEVKSEIYTIKDIAQSKEYKLNFAGIVELIKE